MGKVVYQKGKASATRDLFCVARGVVRVVQANVDSTSVERLETGRWCLSKYHGDWSKNIEKAWFNLGLVWYFFRDLCESPGLVDQSLEMQLSEAPQIIYPCFCFSQKEYRSVLLQPAKTWTRCFWCLQESFKLLFSDVFNSRCSTSLFVDSFATLRLSSMIPDLVKNPLLVSSR